MIITFRAFVWQIPGSSSDEPVEGRTGDKQEETAVKEAEATLLYAAAEMSSTDDEAESGRISFNLVKWNLTTLTTTSLVAKWSTSLVGIQRPIP